MKTVLAVDGNSLINRAYFGVRPLTNSGGQRTEAIYGMINMILFGGFFLVSLAILIQKRQEIKAYRSSEWMDRRCVKCFFLSPGVIVIMILMAINMVTMFFMY